METNDTQFWRLDKLEPVTTVEESGGVLRHWPALLLCLCLPGGSPYQGIGIQTGEEEGILMGSVCVWGGGDVGL